MEDLRHFKDRTAAIAAFDHLWDPGSGWILPYTGFSGHGKTTLLAWLEANRCRADARQEAARQEAARQEARGGPGGSLPYARLSLTDAIDDLFLLFNDLLDQLRPLLPKPTYREYRQAQQSIHERLELARTSIQQTMHVADADSVDQSQTAHVSEMIDAQAYQAARDLAERWLTALAEIRLPARSGEPARLVFLFDNYDFYQQRTSRKELALFWATLQRAYRLLPGLRVVLASRERILFVNEIQALQSGLYPGSLFELEPLSLADSDALMADLGVSDARFRLAVFERLAHGHPLMTRMAAEAWTGDSGSDASHGGIREEAIPALVERDEVIEWLYGRILENLPDDLKEVARWSALLRAFNADILHALVGIDLADQFRAFTRFSFIRPHGNCWSFHPLVRRVQIAYLQRERPEAFRGFQQKAVEYFTRTASARAQHADQGGPADQSGPADLEALYHQFFVEPQSAFKTWQTEAAAAGYRYDHPRWAQLVEIGLAEELKLSPLEYARVLSQDGDRKYYQSNNLQARERYEQALPIYQTAGSRLGESNCIKRLGDVHRMLAEYPQARERYEQALPIYQTAGSRLGEANCIRSIGDVHLQLAEYPQARERYAQAMALYQAIGGRAGEANCIRSIGDVHLQLAEYPQARERFEQALILYQAIGGRLGEAICIRSLGDVHFQLAEFSQARERFEQALILYQAIGGRAGEANCLRSMGDVHRMLAEYPQARERYAQAMALYQAIGGRAGEANCIRSIGDVHLQLAEYPQARERFEQALPICQTIGNRVGEANCIKSLGDVHNMLEEYPQARERYEQALILYQAISGRVGEANCLKGLGEVHLQLKEYPQAQERYENALPIYRAIGDRLGEANCIFGLGEMHRMLAEFSQALERYEQAMALYRAIGISQWEAYCVQHLEEVQQKLSASSPPPE